MEERRCKGCPWWKNHLPEDHRCPNRACGKRFIFEEGHECDGCPCSEWSDHTPSQHRCSKIVCNELFLFEKGHECKACPCDFPFSHLPKNHICTGCYKTILYPTDLHHCCSGKKCSSRKPCDYHQRKISFALVGLFSLQLPRELIEHILKMD